MYHALMDGSKVCIKRVRVYTRDGPEKAIKVRRRCRRFSYSPPLTKLKAFCQEAVMWKRLADPNILPLLGVTLTPLQLISDWMPGGDLPEYIKKHPDADRLDLVGIPSIVFVTHSLPLPGIRRR